MEKYTGMCMYSVFGPVWKEVRLTCNAKLGAPTTAISQFQTQLSFEKRVVWLVIKGSVVVSFIA